MTAPAARAIRFDRYGDRDVLYVADIDMPSPGPGEVVVEVRAAGINPGEAGIRQCTRCSPPRFRPARAATWPVS
jgi:NADPH2:quinone reductase